MTGFPINPPRAAISDQRGFVSPEWYRYFAQIQSAVGSASSETWQDGYILAPGPVSGVSSSDVEGGGASIPCSVVTTAVERALWPTDYAVLADATSYDVTIMLADAAQAKGRSVVIKKIDASVNAVILEAPNGQTIDGGGPLSITTQWQSYTLISDGKDWFII